jgi:hypothetical protein
MCYNGFLDNQIVRFGSIDCPIFLNRGPSILFVADVSVTAISCVVASIAKTLSRSGPS